MPGPDPPALRCSCGWTSIVDVHASENAIRNILVLVLDGLVDRHWRAGHDVFAADDRVFRVVEGAALLLAAQRRGIA